MTTQDEFELILKEQRDGAAVETRRLRHQPPPPGWIAADAKLPPRWHIILHRGRRRLGEWIIDGDQARVLATAGGWTLDAD